MDLFAYIILRAFLGFVGFLPSGAALWLGRVSGSVAFYLSSGRRAMASENMSRAFGGEKTEEEVTSIIRSLYKNLGMSVVEFATLGRLTSGNIDDYVSFEGLHHYDAALEKGRGMVALTAHFGNWELLNTAMALKGYAASVVARPLDNAYVDAFVEQRRTLAGAGVIPRDSALRKMMETLKGNGILGVLFDQRPPRRDAVMVDFFGRPARTNKGLAAVVMKTGAVVVPTFIIREGTSRPGHRIICAEPIDIAATGDKERDIEENTRRFNLAIEGFVRKYPDEWFWLHSRWERRKKAG